MWTKAHCLRPGTKYAQRAEERSMTAAGRRATRKPNRSATGWRRQTDLYFRESAIRWYLGNFSITPSNTADSRGRSSVLRDRRQQGRSGKQKCPVGISVAERVRRDANPGLASAAGLRSAASCLRAYREVFTACPVMRYPVPAPGLTEMLGILVASISDER